MKRRRRVVVSQGAVVTSDDTPTCTDGKHNNKLNNNTDDYDKKDNDNTTSLNGTPNVPNSSSPAPACSLFSRFQQRSSDFSGEWLMMEEADVPLVPPISHELAEKLRQHQGTIQKERCGAAAPGRKDGKEALHTTPAAGTATLSVGGRETSDVEDEEHVPQDVGVKKLLGGGDDGGEGVGIHGDYLSFLPPSSALSDVAQSDLQATLTVQEGRDGRVVSKSSSTQSLRSRSKEFLLTRQRVVPLWSVERYTTHGGYASNAAIALHQEVCDFVKYLRPSEAEIFMRRIIAMEVRTIAKRLWPDCEPIVFGSMSTGLLLPLSDLDMSILKVPVTTEEALTALAREISREGLCHAAYPQLILKTKVPLVKFQHRLSLLDVDVSINAEDGQRNSAIVADMLCSFPEARPLIVLVKYFLQQRGMHEPYHGGLGSFATTLLVISFLQNHPIYTERPEERAYTGLGTLLVDFFRYYGMYFNYHQCGISLLDGGRYFLRGETSALTPSSPTGQSSSQGLSQVMIEDPGCVQNNAASSLRIFHVITSVFTHAYMALTALFDAPVGVEQEFLPDAMEIARRPTLLSRILHVDGPSVARRQFIDAAYDGLLQDPAQKEKLMAMTTASSMEEMVAIRKVQLQGGASWNGSTNIQERKRPRSGSGSGDSSNTSSSSTSSNSSSVCVAFRRHRRR
ncbi:putative DNA polymerase sigma [Trypanosoma cruzi]|nr:putative DNA polymerase sigma [Trypanosoma cruzi]